MANIPRQPIFVPVPRPTSDRGKQDFSRHDVLTAQKPPRFQPFEFWPEIRRPYESPPFVRGTQNTLTSILRRFYPFQFWPEPRPPRNWEEKVAFDFGTSTALTSVGFLPRFAPFAFWPEAKPLVKDRQPFIEGTPNTLTAEKPPVFEPFQQWPESRPLLKDRVPFVDLGVPTTITSSGDPFRPFAFWPEARPPRNWEEKVAFQLGTSTCLTNVAFLPQFSPFQFWLEGRPLKRDEQIQFQVGTPETLTSTPVIETPPPTIFEFWPEIRRSNEEKPNFELGTPSSITGAEFPPEFSPFEFWLEGRPRQRDEQVQFSIGTPNTLTIPPVVTTPFTPYQFWPEIKRTREEKLDFELGTSTCLISVQFLPQFQSFQFWPEARPQRIESLPYIQGSPDSITSVKPPIFYPFQFWPEARPARQWQDQLGFDLGTSTALTSIAFLPQFQSFQFWPESRPVRLWEEKLAFSFGSPRTLVSPNPKFQQDFVLRPEIRLPVVPHQPSALGSPLTLIPTVPLAGISAALDVTVDNLIPAITAGVVVSAALNETVDNLTLSATVSALEGFVLNSTIDNLTSDASAQVVVSANLNQTLDNLSLNATGTVIASSDFILNSTIDAIVGSLTSTVVVSANLNETIDNLTLDATGTVFGERDYSLNTSIGEITLAAHLTKVRISVGENVAWWYEQYKSRHEALKKIPLEGEGYIVSPEIYGRGKAEFRVSKSDIESLSVIGFGVGVKGVAGHSSEEALHTDGIGKVVVGLSAKADIIGKSFNSYIIASNRISGKINTNVPFAVGKVSARNIINSSRIVSISPIVSLKAIGWVDARSVINSAEIVGISPIGVVNSIGTTIYDGIGQIVCGSIGVTAEAAVGSCINSEIYTPIVGLKIGAILVDQVKSKIITPAMVGSVKGSVQYPKTIGNGNVNLHRVVIGAKAEYQAQERPIRTGTVAIQISMIEMKSRAEYKIIYPVAYGNGNVIGFPANINAIGDHDPDDEDSLSAVLLLAA